jgi:HlyD family secretion protein
VKKVLIILLLLALAAAAAYYYIIHKEAEKDANEIILYGNVDIRQVELGFRVQGRVAKMFFDEGDLVKPGQLMSFLEPQPYEDRVAQAKASVVSTQTSLNNLESILKRRQELIGSGSVSVEDLNDTQSQRDIKKADLLQAQAELGVAETNFKDTFMYCPTEGTILTRIREPGSVVEPSIPIYTLSIKSPVWIRAFVNEPNLAKIYPGMPAEIFSDTPGTPIYKGTIGFISPIAEFTPKTVESTDLRTDLVYRLRVVIPEPDKWLRQGMPVTVKLRNELGAKESPPRAE